MAFTIPDDELGTVSKLSNYPNRIERLKAAALKAQFDADAKTVMGALKRLIQELGLATAARNVGFKKTTAVNADNVQDAIENVQRQIAGVSQSGIADASITAAKIADGAVGTAAIADDAITADKLARSAVDTDAIKWGAVDAYRLKDAAVTEAKLANGAVTESKIGYYAVTEKKIASGAVTSEKIANRTINSAKMGDASVTERALCDGAVTKDKVADGAVTEEKLAAGAVTAEKLASDALDSVLNAYFLKVYPVGAFYFSASSDNPATLFGGTWTQIKDTFILAAGTKYKAGTTGGEATHALTVPEMPNHYHDEYAGNDGGDSSAPSGYIGWPSISYTSDKTWLAKLAKTSGTGGGAAHNNMPPYLAVYVWQRTA